MTDAPVLVRVLRRDRAIVAAGLIGVAALAGLYLLFAAGGDSPSMGEMAMPMPAASWSPDHFATMFAMWVAMMVAMMLPAAAPVILLHASIARRRAAGDYAATATGLFMLGYLLVWSGFGLAATVLQWRLDAAALLSPAMAVSSVAAAGVVFIAAGVYQWTPLKQACLRRCRSPLDFILGNWREGPRGALAMGLRHGLFCLGCCWMLMLLLFVGGVMNPLWVGGLAVLVLVEKIVPGGGWLGRGVGLGLIGWGAATLLTLA